MLPSRPALTSGETIERCDHGLLQDKAVYLVGDTMFEHMALTGLLLLASDAHDHTSLLKNTPVA